MQHTQYNFVQVCAGVMLVASLVLAATPASAGGITHAAKPDPLLDGGDTSPCMAGADLAAGTDATGEGVIPADVGAPRVMAPDEIMVPLGRQAGRRNPVTGAGGGTYAGFDGRRMAPLLNPRPCR